MKYADIPAKIALPFATNANPVNVSPIPDTTSVPGQASFNLGFPPETMQPLSSGGIPPAGQQFNGLFQQITAWNRWQGSGGPSGFDAAFSTGIGGYPKGAILSAANGVGAWVSISDDNGTNPDTGGNGWLFLPFTQISNGNPNGTTPGQAGGTTTPASLCWDRKNIALWVCETTGDAATAVWRALPLLTPVVLGVGAGRQYVGEDISRVFVRSNGGSVMNDALPDGTVDIGWNVTIINGDAAGASLVITSGPRSLNGVVGATVTLLQNQNVSIAADAAGDFWMTQVPIPRVFSAQEIYVNASAAIVPGAYAVDTSGGAPITLTLEGSPPDGDNYRFRDVGGTLATSACIIDPGASAADIDKLDVDWSESYLIFKNSGWRLM